MKKNILGILIVLSVFFVFKTVNAQVLKYGLQSRDVTSLQQMLINDGFLKAAVPTGFFGKLTQEAVTAFQQAQGITADGVAGTRTMSLLNNFKGKIGKMHLPFRWGNIMFSTGCTSNTGYSTTTGLSCAITTTYPAGCTSNLGYSVTTGQSCGSTTPVSYPPGCNSNTGYSSTTGLACGSMTGTTTSTIVWDTYTGNGVTFQYPDSSNLSPYVGFQKPTVVVTSQGSSNIDSNGCLTAYGADPKDSTITTNSGMNFCLSQASDDDMQSNHTNYYYTTLEDGSYYTIEYSVASSECVSLNEPYADTPCYTDSQMVPLILQQSVSTLTFISTPATGNLTLSLDSTSPASSTVMVSSSTTTSGITALVFDLQNTTSNTINVTSVAATLGSNNPSTSGSYSLFDGTENITGGGYNYNPNDPSAIRFSGSLMSDTPSLFLIAPNSTAVLTIKFDAVANATGFQSVSVNANQIIAEINGTTTPITTVGSAMGGTLTFIGGTSCQTLYWTDNNNQNCGNPKQFCGMYMYQGLQTFATQTQCRASVTPSAGTISVTEQPNTCVASNSSVAGAPSTMTCVIPYSVANISNSNVYIPQATTVTGTTPAITFIAVNSVHGSVGDSSTLTGNATVSQIGGTAVNNSGNDWRISPGTTASFTGEYVLTDTNSSNPGDYRAYLDGVPWGTTSGNWNTMYLSNLGFSNPNVAGYVLLQ